MSYSPSALALRSTLALVLASSLLDSTATAQGTCTPRNGSGVNPSGFTCVSDPLIGTNWSTTVDIVSAGADTSAVSVFLGGPLAGTPLAIGELLCSPPVYFTDVAAGSHSIPVPPLPFLVGQTFSTQAATIDSLSGLTQLQNAIDITIGAPAGEDISVLVLWEDESVSAALVPLVGAVVTLQGTDALSLTGLTASTDLSGTAFFPGVSGPYNVTAQYDFTGGGETLRQASSVVAIAPTTTGSPPAGTIGVLMSTESEPDYSVNAWLAGKVQNMPALSGSEYVQVVAVGHAPYEFEWSTPADPATGDYLLAIPSNVPIDCLVLHRSSAFVWSSPILASLMEPAVGQTGPGTTLGWDFDFASPEVVPWNIPVSFTASGVHPALDIGLQLYLEHPTTGVRYDFSFFDGPGPPASFNLPDVTRPEFGGYRIELSADTEDPDYTLEVGQEYGEFVTATPSVFQAEFALLPSILTPAYLATLTTAQFDALTVQVIEADTGSFGTSVVNLLFLESEGAALPPGVDVVEWALFSPPGLTSYDLPPLSLPMFAAPQDLYCGFEQFGMQGFTFDFASFFSADLAAQLDLLETSITSSFSSDIAYPIFLIP